MFQVNILIVVFAASERSDLSVLSSLNAWEYQMKSLQ